MDAFAALSSWLGLPPETCLRSQLAPHSVPSPVLDGEAVSLETTREIP